MRVVLLSVSAGLGGSETSLLALLGGLAPRPDIEPVLVLPREGALEARARAAGARTHVLPMPDALLSFGEWSMRGAADMGRRGKDVGRALSSARTYRRALNSLLRDVRPDVIHTNGFKMHVLAARAADADVPIVWHVHEYLSRRPLSRVLLRHHVRRVSAVVANSHSVAADLAVALGATASVHTIYNAVDLAEFSPAGETIDLDALSGLAPTPTGTIRVGLLATFARWKGHDVFLRALQQTRAPVRAYVIGSPIYDTIGSQLTVEELRRRAGELGIADRVGFTGFVERPAQALRTLDIVVHASTEPEPFGLVIAEGMACGRPVIVSRAGGAAEIVEQGVDAVTIEPGDAAGLADAIDRLAADEPLRSRLGSAARASALRRFDQTAFADRFVDLYARVVRPSAVSA